MEGRSCGSLTGRSPLCPVSGAVSVNRGEVADLVARPCRWRHVRIGSVANGDALAALIIALFVFADPVPFEDSPVADNIADSSGRIL